MTHQYAYPAPIPRPRAHPISSQKCFLSLPVMGAMAMVVLQWTWVLWFWRKWSDLGWLIRLHQQVWSQSVELSSHGTRFTPILDPTNLSCSRFTSTTKFFRSRLNIQGNPINRLTDLKFRATSSPRSSWKTPQVLAAGDLLSALVTKAK